jgi:enediyne biosynthesis protein E4
MMAMANLYKSPPEPLSALIECADAQWVDLDANQRPDLVLAGNWSPLSILLNAKEGFEMREVEGSAGLWNCLSAPADADGDGDLDLVAGNWGLNSNLQANGKEPIGLWVRDFDGNGSFDPILSYYRQGKRRVFADKNLLVSQIPNFKKRYLAHKKYAESPFESIFPEAMLQRAQHRSAQQLQTCLIENRGDADIALHALPGEAQYSMTQGASFVDLNGDDRLDILLLGNQATVQPSLGRMDANFGCALIQESKGKYRHWPNRERDLYISGTVTDLICVPFLGKATLFYECEGRLFRATVR